jgi:uncharacterized damage-inducible protein DinB
VGYAGFRLAGVLNHGSAHHSQICATLTAIGVGAPQTDVLDFGIQVGCVMEKMPDA